MPNAPSAFAAASRGPSIVVKSAVMVAHCRPWAAHRLGDPIQSLLIECYGGDIGAGIGEHATDLSTYALRSPGDAGRACPIVKSDPSMSTSIGLPACCFSTMKSAPRLFGKTALYVRPEPSGRI